MVFWRRGKIRRCRNSATTHLDAVTNQHDLPDGARLTGAQRRRVEAALKRAGVGDVIERSMFVAALDYQLAAFSDRLRRVQPARDTARLQRACNRAAETLEGPSQEQLRAVCEAFVAELARAYDACFDIKPTPDEHGPFGHVLASLRESIGLALPCDGDLLDRAIGAGRMPP
jgi:hypothetical protein